MSTATLRLEPLGNESYLRDMAAAWGLSYGTLVQMLRLRGIQPTRQDEFRRYVYDRDAQREICDMLRAYRGRPAQIAKEQRLQRAAEAAEWMTLTTAQQQRIDALEATVHDLEALLHAEDSPDALRLLALMATPGTASPEDIQAGLTFLLAVAGVWVSTLTEQTYAAMVSAWATQDAGMLRGQMRALTIALAMSLEASLTVHRARSSATPEHAALEAELHQVFNQLRIWGNDSLEWVQQHPSPSSPVLAGEHGTHPPK